MTTMAVGKNGLGLKHWQTSFLKHLLGFFKKTLLNQSKEIMMRYTTLSTIQLLILAVVMSVLVAVLVSINIVYQDFRLLPEVHVDGTGACIKVVNFENGHAFNCADMNVLLRRYRTVKESK